MEKENAESNGSGDELEAKRREFLDSLLAATRETPSERNRFVTCGFNVETTLLKKVEAVLRPWLNEVGGEECNSELYPHILAIPLHHECASTKLSFANLKGEDWDLIQVLLSCLDKRLDVHLFLMTWKEDCAKLSGPGEFGLNDERITTSSWIDVNNEKLQIFPWNSKCRTEVVLGKDEKLFYKYPDLYEYTGRTGTKGPSSCHFYHQALVGIWPKSKAVATITESRRPNNKYFTSSVPKHAEVLSLLNMVERLHKEKDRHAPLVLRQLLAHCEKKYQGIWETQGCDTEKASCVSSRLLDMCIVNGDLSDTLKVLKLHSEVFQVQKDDSDGIPSHKSPWFIGLRNQLVCKSIAGAVHSHGWTACGEAVLLLLQRTAL